MQCSEWQVMLGLNDNEKKSIIEMKLQVCDKTIVQILNVKF